VVNPPSSVNRSLPLFDVGSLSIGTRRYAEQVAVDLRRLASGAPLAARRHRA
jgi:hypothetical protein